MPGTIILDEGDLQGLRDRQSLSINMKKFEISMLELAFNVIKTNTLRKYGLDADKNYQIDPRGLVVPLEETPQEPSPGQ